MDIIFFGTPHFAVPSLEKLLEHPAFTVRAVVTQPDKRRGRGNQLLPAPVKVIALAQQLPIYQPRRVKKHPQTLEQLQAAQADAFVVVAYGQILSPEILAMPRLGCINAHGSLLPKYRGAAPIQWSIYHGETETGITSMLMDAGMDTGPMLLTARTPIALLENAHDLSTRLAALSADLLVETLLKLEHQEIQPVAQDNAQATMAPLIQKSDYELNWARAAIDLHHQIRGFYPDCTTSFRGERLKVTASAPLVATTWNQLPPDLQALEAEVAKIAAAAPVGTIVAIAKGKGPLIQTGAGLLLLQAVQLAGKRPQTGADFANGSRLSLGERFI